MNKEYIEILEKENEVLNTKLAQYDLICDILDSKVNVIRSDLYAKIKPLSLCAFLEKHGWKQRYEKQHERYLTRCYESQKKDIKVKIHLTDNNFERGSRSSDISKRIRITIDKFCGLHGCGHLLVIFNILKDQV